MKIAVSRRAFLAGLGLGPGLLPFVSGDFARAGCLMKPPKRIISVVWTNGVMEWAGGSGTGFSLPGSMKGLEPYKGDIIPIRGLRIQNLRDTPNPKGADGAGHGATPALLTGRKYFKFEPFVEIAGGPSIDAFVAAALQKQGVNTPRATLNLGVSSDDYIASWRDANQRAVPDNDPFHAFADIFGGSAVGDPLAAKRLALRGSVLDLVKRDLAVYKASVGKENGDRIEAHLTSVRELEKQLQSMATGGGAMPAGCLPPSLGEMFTVNKPNFDKVTKAQMDLTVAALAADVTRAVTIQLGTEGNLGVIPTWLGFKQTGDTSSGVGDSNGMHSIAHRGGGDKVKLDGWFFDQFAYLIGKLKNEKEGDGSSMLEHTAVLFANHMSNGGGHGTDNVPFLLAGRCGGYFKTGQAISGIDTVHTAVLKEMIRAMNVDPKGFFEPAYDADLPAVRA